MNIIVIICDTLRRDFLGYYGNGRMRTPHIDRLASESLIFDRAFIGSFPTIPLRAELMTGQHVFHTTGWAPLAPGQTTLQSYLQGQGYVTAMITDNVQYLNPGMNLPCRLRCLPMDPRPPGRPLAHLPHAGCIPL